MLTLKSLDKIFYCPWFLAWINPRMVSRFWINLLLGNAIHAQKEYRNWQASLKFSCVKSEDLCQISKSQTCEVLKTYGLKV